MYHIQKDIFHTSHTTSSRYLVEKLLQQVDFTEVISNRHGTTNGFVLIHEIFNLSWLVFHRGKIVSRLKRAIEEGRNPTLSFSIVNDRILQTYCTDIVAYYRDLRIETLSESNSVGIQDILNRSEINVMRLEREYLSLIRQEMETIDFSSGQIERNCRLINDLVACLVPRQPEFYVPKNFLYTGAEILNRQYEEAEKSSTHFEVEEFREGQTQGIIEWRHSVRQDDQEGQGIAAA